MAVTAVVYVSVSDLARLLGVSRPTVYRWIEDGGTADDGELVFLTAWRQAGQYVIDPMEAWDFWEAYHGDDEPLPDDFEEFLVDYGLLEEEEE